MPGRDLFTARGEAGGRGESPDTDVAWNKPGYK